MTNRLLTSSAITELVVEHQPVCLSSAGCAAFADLGDMLTAWPGTFLTRALNEVPLGWRVSFALCWSAILVPGLNRACQGDGEITSPGRCWILT